MITPEVTERYTVTCTNCKGTSKITIIDGTKVNYEDHLPIIACRFRSDLKWGFECVCGNDTRMAKQEFAQKDLLLKGSSEQVINAVIDRMSESSDDSFVMELV